MSDRDDLEQLTGDRDPGMVKGGPALPRATEDVIDGEDLWTDYRTEREHVGPSDRAAFLAGVNAGRRTARPATPTAEPATVCPFRACSEPHTHGPTGERHNAFDNASASEASKSGGLSAF